MTREDKGNCIMIAEFMGAKIIERENRVVCDFLINQDLIGG